LGYHHHHILINSQYFVPQKRERIYIVGVSKDICNIEQFKQLISSIEISYEIQKRLPIPRIKDILENDVPDKYTLSDKLWNFLQEHSKKHSAKGNGFGFSLINPEIDLTSRTLTARYYKDGSEILIKQNGKNPRKLTPRECARIMGFPESFKIKVSDTQAYKQFGNSVVVSVVKLFSENMMNFLKTIQK